MNKSDLIIKIAFGVSAAALLFSAVTLIRTLIIGGNALFPVIQVFGSAAIFAICALMLRSIRTRDDEESDDETQPEDTADTAKETKSEEAADLTEETAQELEEDTDPSEEIDRLYQKYHLSDFEE